MSDWSSDVCSSDLLAGLGLDGGGARLLERDRPALYRLQLLALQELSGLQGEQLVGRLCDLQGADGGLAPIDKIGQRRLVACDLADHLRLQLDRGAQRLACLLPARLRVAGHVADAGAGAVTVRIQACVTSPPLLDVERTALGLLQPAPAVPQPGA